MSELAEHAAMLLGGILARAENVHGGDLSSVLKITLADGREAIVKVEPAPLVEAEMLRAIAATGAPAPKVLAVDEDALVMEVLPNRGSLGKVWGRLGSALAILHAVTGPYYGWGEDYAFGPLAIANTQENDWPGFWGERRLLNNLPYLSSDLARRVEALAVQLANRLPAAPPAALLHGDLWGGNILVDGDRISGLIDPACYYGHCEVDLAMLTLFDRPGAAFYEAYGPLAPGHEERLIIYKLWPALVHLRLFGDGYRPMVDRLLMAAGV